MIRGLDAFIRFLVVDTTTGRGRTGDAANITLRLRKDNATVTPTGSTTEVDSTNMKGLYQVELSASEMDFAEGAVMGESSTADTMVYPTMLSTVNYPLIADNFVEAGGAASQVFIAGSGNNSFPIGMRFSVFFSDLESGSLATTRHGAEFMGSIGINVATGAFGHIIGGYRMSNDTTPVIVPASKFGVCINMQDADLFKVTGGNWTGTHSTFPNNGEENRTKAGWTFVIKQNVISLGLTSGDPMQIRSIAGVSGETYGLGTQDPVEGTVLDKIMNKDSNRTFDQATDSLEAIRDRGDSEWTGGAGGGDGWGP